MLKFPRLYFIIEGKSTDTREVAVADSSVSAADAAYIGARANALRTQALILLSAPDSRAACARLPVDASVIRSAEISSPLQLRPHKSRAFDG